MEYCVLPLFSYLSILLSRHNSIHNSSVCDHNMLLVCGEGGYLTCCVGGVQRTSFESCFLSSHSEFLGSNSGCQTGL